MTLLTSAFCTGAAIAQTETAEGPTSLVRRFFGADLLEGLDRALQSPITELDLWPALSPQALLWISIAIVLMLTMQGRKLFSWRNIDALVFAFMALLAALRSIAPTPISPEAGAPGVDFAFWSRTLLAVCAGYWLLRGLMVLIAVRVPAATANVSEGAMAILIAVGLLFVGSRIVSAPVAPDSIDGCVGGACIVETGHLPYGDAPRYDGRSPLLYLVHAPAAALLPPKLEMGENVTPMNWSSRLSWLDHEYSPHSDWTGVRLTNLVLVGLTLIALVVIGRKLHSNAMAATLVVLLSVMPGAGECFVRPAIMLPTMLLTWSIAFAVSGGVWSLFSMLALIFAGVASPWAFLAVPLLLFYHFRRGSEALLSLLGLIVGAGAVVAGVALLVAPSIPRTNGALVAANLAPQFTAHATENGGVMLEHAPPMDTPGKTFKTWLWAFMLERDQLAMNQAEQPLSPPAGVNPRDVRFGMVAPTADARPLLQAQYRDTAKWSPFGERFLRGARTVLEAVWLPDAPIVPPMPGSWEVWTEKSGVSPETWTIIRRSGKLVVGLLALFAAFSMSQARRLRPGHLVGGFVVIATAASLVDWGGATYDQIWFLAPVMALLAVNFEGPVKEPLTVNQLPSLYPAQPETPRVTINAPENGARG